MKKNILFILIDGLRADLCFGIKKTSKTNFINKLSSKGISFTNTFSSADGTFISLNCLFNSKFQFETGLRARQIILQKENYLEILQKNNYEIYGIIPELTSLKPLRKYFKNNDCTYFQGPPPDTLSTGLDDKIHKTLKELKTKEQWFFYLHLFDLHPLREGRLPKNLNQFDSEEYGDNLHAKTLSMIDNMLMKIFKDIDLDNTIIILTSDHGEIIPYDGKISSDFEPKFSLAKKIGKNVIPKSYHNNVGKVFGTIKKSIGNKRLEESNKTLSNYEKRSRDPYFTLSLFDELLHIPLIISGLEKQNVKINNFVSALDIFPTILDYLEIKDSVERHGTSLIPLINNQNFNRKPIFLHTIPYEKESLLDRIGIRTDEFKYFRNARNSKKDINLYDIISDPFENYNIAKENPMKVQEMEEILDKIQVKKTESNVEENEEEISEELRKLGYL